MDEQRQSIETKTDFGSLYRVYENYFTDDGKIGEFDIQDFGMLFDDYGGDWLLEAMREAHRHRKCSLAYLSAILKEWKERGQPKPKKKESHSKQQSRHDMLSALNEWISEGGDPSEFPGI